MTTRVGHSRTHTLTELQRIAKNVSQGHALAHIAQQLQQADGAAGSSPDGHKDHVAEGLVAGQQRVGQALRLH